MSANEEEAARRRANVRMKVVVKRKEERITQADSAAATKNLLLICLCSGEPQGPSPLTTNAAGAAWIPPPLTRQRETANLHLR